MSRLDDLIDLLKVAHDSYFSHPASYARFVFIQLDDLCELTIKSFLQNQTRLRQESFKSLLASSPFGGVREQLVRRFLKGQISQAEFETQTGLAGANLNTLRGLIVSHSPLQDWIPHRSGPTDFKSFDDIVHEARLLQPFNGVPDNELILQRFLEKRKTRNQFFHDPDQSNLTVEPAEVLKMFGDLYTLFSLCFDKFAEAVEAKPNVKAQIQCTKLLNRRETHALAEMIYNSVLRDCGEQRVPFGPELHPAICLSRHSGRILAEIEYRFETELEARNAEIDRIDQLKRRQRRHELAKLRGQNDIVSIRKLRDYVCRLY